MERVWNHGGSDQGGEEAEGDAENQARSGEFAGDVGPALQPIDRGDRDADGHPVGEKLWPHDDSGQQAAAVGAKASGGENAAKKIHALHSEICKGGLDDGHNSGLCGYKSPYAMLHDGVSGKRVVMAQVNPRFSLRMGASKKW